MSRERPCPSCGFPLEVNDLAVAEGVTSCRECNARVQLVADPETDTSGISVEAIPPGCWISEREGATVIGSTLRNDAGCFLLVWASVWNVGISVFLVLLASEWIKDLWSGTLDSDLLLRTAFFGPFFLIGIGSAYFCALNAAGTLEVVVGEEQIAIFRGVGRIGWTRCLETSIAEGARIALVPGDPSDCPCTYVEIGRVTPIRFGGMLPDDRKKWVCVAVDAAIRARSSNARSGNAYR